MKKLIIAILVVLSISPAYAERGWGGRGGWVAPVFVGGMIANDLAYPYRYAYPYSYPVYEQPYPVYVQSAPPPQVAPAQPIVPTWYYCNSSKGYYPYVANCPEGWRPVAAQPPEIAPR